VVEWEAMHEQDRLAGAAVDVGELAGGDLGGFHAAEIPLSASGEGAGARLI
jgi:hypothetical protein